VILTLEQYHEEASCQISRSKSLSSTVIVRTQTRPIALPGLFKC